MQFTRIWNFWFTSNWIVWIKVLNWEVSSMDDFLLFLANIVLLNEDDDWLRWTLKNNGILTFARIVMFYEALPLSLFLGKVFGEWRLLDEFHFLFGLWLGIRYSLGIIWTIIVDWCCMCWHCGENVDHLLIYCEKAQQLWCFILRSFGFS